MTEDTRLNTSLKAKALFFSVFIIATCGLIYELVVGALASYLLGDSITQFSLVIGTYLSAMGLGSYLSKYVGDKPLRVFIGIEILVGLIGGFSATALFFIFSSLPLFKPFMFLILTMIGVLVGLEIPLLMVILKERIEFKDLVAQVLFLDYIGALFASVLFPFLFVPQLGLLQTSFFFGIANVCVALWAIFLFRRELENSRGLKFSAILSLLVLVGGFMASGQMHRFAERRLYDGTPIYLEKTRYQRIVVTHNRNDIRLYLSGHLQFSSKDEYRYHEALVHPVFSVCAHPKRVLILGGGDGLAVREVLKYPSVERIQLVDLDPKMTSLFRDEPILNELNDKALSASRLAIENNDAMRWLQDHDEIFDIIIIDLPDPSNYSIGKLYSKSFYDLVRLRLSETGAFVVQSTSPYQARQSYWCIARTIEASGCHISPYHCYVPSFGEWGFVLGLKRKRPVPGALPTGQLGRDLKLKYLNDQVLAQLFQFPPDMGAVEAEVNYLDTQVLVSYYNKEWD